MRSGNLFYYAFNTNSLKEVVKEILYIAKEEMDCDAFSVQTLMDNTVEMYEELNFHKGDGALHYYLVNWSLGDEII